MDHELAVLKSKARRTLDAGNAPAAIARLLDVAPRTPLVFIESVAWDAEGQPFHFFQSWLRTDRIRIEIGVSRSRNGAP